MSFYKDFIWGAATSAYQIEGAPFEDGKGASVWDMVCKQKDFVFRGQNGKIACDHYHRYKEDVMLMKEIGLQGYRFSISWPRVIPSGVGKINSAGISFYDKLIDELLASGIEPFVTLFHWDYPYELYKRGGWLNSKSPDWFAEYTEVVVKYLGDRVKNWITINEPQCFLHGGHMVGSNAPGLKLDIEQVLLAGHNSLLAHGKSVQTIRSISPQKCNIGMAPCGLVYTPASDAPEDIEAARMATFAVSGPGLWNSSWWSDPVFLGEYPRQGVELFADKMPNVNDGDMKIISEPLDYYGVNFYAPLGIVAADGNDSWKEVGFPSGSAMSMMGLDVVPEIMYWGTKFFYEKYNKPIYILENGMSGHDWVHMDGKVHDAHRIDFMSRYLDQLKKSIENGIDVRGYFHWSLMDNFEWILGYRERFGLIHIDFDTQKRTLKDSAYWYRDYIKNNTLR